MNYLCVLFGACLFVTYPLYEVKAESSIQHETPKINNDFIDTIAKHAIKLAQEYDVYPSIMIAQASLESGYGSSGLSQSPYHNLFGTKGLYEGKGKRFETKEEDSTGVYSINATFRQYPSYYESLVDYCELLQNGITNNENFYKGTWRSATSSYKEATAYLTGRYATDRHYNEKLNSIIKQFNLDEFDHWLEEEIEINKKNQQLKEEEKKKNIKKIKKEETVNLLEEVVSLIPLNESNQIISEKNKDIEVTKFYDSLTLVDLEKVVVN